MAVPDQSFTVFDGVNEVKVIVRRDRRLKKMARWVFQPDGSVLLRVPHRVSQAEVRRILDRVAAQLAKRRKRSAASRSDADLQARAERINREYLGGAAQWMAIRWVSNMKNTLGSCTNGGSTDGHIRISDRIRNWPGWVIDYVIAHELAHRVHPNHSPAFWEYLNKAYPLTERARGFIMGVGFAQDQLLGEDD